MRNRCYIVSVYLCLLIFLVLLKFFVVGEMTMKKIKAITSVLLAAVMLVMCSIAGLSVFAPQADAASAGTWIASWSTAAVNGSISLPANIQFNDFIPARSVVRTQLQISAGGLYTRLCFSNEYGTSNLKIGAVSIAKTDTATTAAIQPETATPVTFNDGQTSATIKPGEVLWSDSVYFPTNSLDYITVSVFYPSTTYIKTGGLYGGRSFLNIAANESAINNKNTNASNEIKIASGAITYHTVPFLTRVDVRSTYADAYSVVFLGDSTLTNEAYHYFAQRAYTAGYTHVGFVNNSIVANRLLHDGTGLIGNLYGKAVIDRFDRDAVKMTGAKAVLVKIGLNDILHPMTESMKGEAPYSSVEDIIAGYEQIIRQARAAGMKVYFFTKTAWKGYEREFLGQTGDLSWTKDAQKMCDQLDAWIKSTNLIDGYFEMTAMDNPVDSDALLPALTTDGAHLTELGAVAMADLIDPAIIGAYSLPSAASINGVNPYASRQSVIDQFNAAQATTTRPTANGSQSNTTTNKNNNNSNNGGNSGNIDIDASIAASVLASREEAANNAHNAGRPTVSTTANNTNATTTTKANSNNNSTTTKPATTTTKPASSTTAAAGTTTSAGTTQPGTTAAGTTSAAGTDAATTVEPAGDSSTTSNVVYNDTTAAAGETFSMAITLANTTGEADEMGAAQQPEIADSFANSGSSIGIGMIVVMVAMIAVAVIVTMNSRRRGN